MPRALDKPRVFKNPDMLAKPGQRHGERRCDIRDSCWAVSKTSKNTASGGIGDGSENMIQSCHNSEPKGSLYRDSSATVKSEVFPHAGYLEQQQLQGSFPYLRLTINAGDFIEKPAFEDTSAQSAENRRPPSKPPSKES
jgi:hypothetical protein